MRAAILFLGLCCCGSWNSREFEGYFVATSGQKIEDCADGKQRTYPIPFGSLSLRATPTANDALDLEWAAFYEGRKTWACATQGQVVEGQVLIESRTCSAADLAIVEGSLKLTQAGAVNFDVTTDSPGLVGACRSQWSALLSREE